MLDPKERQEAFKKVTHMLREKAIREDVFQLHGVTGYSSRLKYVQRNGERLYPWEIEMKSRAQSGSSARNTNRS